MEEKAYAKINLTLDILGKKPNGYHSLDTVMQSIDLFDSIEVKKAEAGDIKVRTNKNYLPLDRKNTVWRAAEFFFEAAGICGGAEISIEKTIPSRAGMGGGSADAAAVLRALNRLYEAGLSNQALMDIGERVGADVPFCIQGGTGRCTDIGQKVERLAPMPSCHLLICKPPMGMSTPKAFQILDKYPKSNMLHTEKMVAALALGKLEKVARQLGNRFEETLRMRQVREIKKLMLESGALNAMMTGSGSAVYGIYTEQRKAEECGSRLEALGEIFLSRPLNSIP